MFWGCGVLGRCQEPTEGPPNVRCARHVSGIGHHKCLCLFPGKYGCFQKIWYPPNHPILIWFSIIFTIHLGGKNPYIWFNTHMTNFCVFWLHWGFFWATHMCHVPWRWWCFDAWLPDPKQLLCLAGGSSNRALRADMICIYCAVPKWGCQTKDKNMYHTLCWGISFESMNGAPYLLQSKICMPQRLRNMKDRNRPAEVNQWWSSRCFEYSDAVLRCWCFWKNI